MSEKREKRNIHHLILPTRKAPLLVSLHTKLILLLTKDVRADPTGTPPAVKTEQLESDSSSSSSAPNSLSPATPPKKSRGFGMSDLLDKSS